MLLLVRKGGAQRVVALANRHGLDSRGKSNEEDFFLSLLSLLLLIEQGREIGRVRENGLEGVLLI